MDKTKKDILDAEITAKKCHSIDPFIVFERMETAADAAMDQWADIRCKPLLEALDQISRINAAPSMGELVDKLKKVAREALTEYKK